MKVNTESTANIKGEGKSLEEVDTFAYLRSGVDTTGGTEGDIKARIGKARGAFVMLNKILKDRTISINTKFIIFSIPMSNMCSTMAVRLGKQQ